MTFSKYHRHDLPGGCELAANIRKHHATLQGLADKYHCTIGQIRSRLNDSGFNTAGEPNTIRPVTRRAKNLKLSAGGSAHYVGGGDYDRGLPRVVVHHPTGKPKPTGLDWEALRPPEEPLTPSPPEILTTPSGHTFQPNDDWVSDKEGLRAANRHQHAPGDSAACPVCDRMRSTARTRRGGPGGRLTEQQRHEICVRYLDGESATSLGDKYNVTGSAITYTLRRAGIRVRTKSEAMRLLYPDKWPRQ